MRIRFTPHGAFWKDTPLLAAIGLIIATGWCGLWVRLFSRHCGFHDFTSVACPTCGGTRALHSIVRGEIVAGLALNPLVILSVVIAFVFVVEVLVTRLLGLPQVSLSLSSNELSLLIKVALILFLVNWAYLITAGV